MCIRMNNAKMNKRTVPVIGKQTAQAKKVFCLLST